MKKIINLIASLSLLILISPVSQAATLLDPTCYLSDVTVDGSDASACEVHVAENNNNYINEINADFQLSSPYSWQEFKINIPTDYSSTSTDNGIVISGDLTDGTWAFDGTLTNPFVIVLKASNSFASYLFNDQQSANASGEFKIIFENGQGVPHDLSHFSIYTTVSNVPLPAALWLFAPALLGFMGFRRKTKR